MPCCLPPVFVVEGGQSGGHALLKNAGVLRIGFCEIVRVAAGGPERAVTRAASGVVVLIADGFDAFACLGGDVKPCLFVYLRFVFWFCAWGRVALSGAARPRCPAGAYSAGP